MNSRAPSLFAHRGNCMKMTLAIAAFIAAPRVGVPRASNTTTPSLVTMKAALELKARLADEAIAGSPSK